MGFLSETQVMEYLPADYDIRPITSLSAARDFLRLKLARPIFTRTEPASLNVERKLLTPLRFLSYSLLFNNSLVVEVRPKVYIPIFSLAAVLVEYAHLLVGDIGFSIRTIPSPPIPRCLSKALWRHSGKLSTVEILSNMVAEPSIENLLLPLRVHMVQSTSSVLFCHS